MIDYSGNQDILKLHKLAFFCSRSCSGSIILKAQDYANGLREKGVCVISGFHTPVEKEVLRCLLKGTQPIIVCPARGLYKRIPVNQRAALAADRLLYVSFFAIDNRRMTEAMAEERNRRIVDLADEVFIAYAHSGGKTEKLLEYAREKGKPLVTLPSLV